MASNLAERLIELPGIEIKGASDSFGENPKDHVPEAPRISKAVGAVIFKKHKSAPENQTPE